ncbi:MAG TPA: hypothetical protein VGO00_23965 [Kofleriaceae bacterium]|nr:hypothetical protein [Kofleriaceae bacterium]
MGDAERFIVAISSLASTVDEEARALAADLGTIAYQERQKLIPGLPAVALSTTDLDVAQKLVAKLQARRHRVQLCRASDVVTAEAMVSLRRFDMTDAGLEAGTERLPWTEISVLVHARHSHETEGVEVVKDKKFNLGRALVTGGLVMRKTVTREIVARKSDSEHVLYLFRASGGTPWLLREQGTHYSALGAALTPTAPRNFAIAVDEFRRRATAARFDDSLLRRSPKDVDLYAHLIATAT